MNNTTEQITSKEKAFLSLREAAEEIGATRRFVEKRIEDGEIAVFRPSRRLVRIKRTEFDRWVQSFSHGGKQTAARSDAQVSGGDTLKGGKDV